MQLENTYTIENKTVLSVIIPVYNSEKWLPDCIRSLMNQTMEDIEYIFVDDKSTDNSVSILQQSYEQHKDKIKIILHEKNKRQGGARNTGIKAAKGEYICFCDSDDFVSPTMYERLYKRILETDSDIVFAHKANFDPSVSYEEACENIKNIDLFPYVNWDPNLYRWNNKPLTTEGHCDVIVYGKGPVMTAIVRKEFIVKNELWFPESLRYEDNFWGSLLMGYVNKISFVPTIEYCYRLHSSSTVHERGGNQYYERLKIEKDLLTEVKKRNLFEKYYPAWVYIFLLRYGVNTIRLLINKFDKIPVKDIRKIRKELHATFPEWKKNYYWHMTNNSKSRVSAYIMMRCPRFYKMAFNIIYIVRGKGQ